MGALRAERLADAPPRGDVIRGSRKTVFVVVDYYLPGYRAGGPTRSVANLIAALGDEADFYVVTRDRDFGDTKAYPGIPTGRWVAADGARVMYLSPSAWRGGAVARVMRDTRHDVLYLNSYFARSTVSALARSRFTRSSGALVVAPRGQFSLGALQMKAPRKRIYLEVANVAGFHSRVRWHATTASEAEAIGRLTRPIRPVIVAPNLAFCAVGGVPDRRPKEPGRLRIATVARLSPMKNIPLAISLLQDLRGAVEYDIYGPHEDARVVAQCLAEVAKLNGAATVRLMGELDPAEVRPTLTNYDLFLLPTLGENFGHAIFDALAAGCPVLISDRTPWRGLTATSAGWDVPLESVDQFREILQRCVAMDADTHAAASRAAVLHAREAAARTAAEALSAYRALFNIEDD